MGKISLGLNVALVLPNKAGKFPVLSKLVYRVNGIPATPNMASHRHRHVHCEMHMGRHRTRVTGAILEKGAVGEMTRREFETGRTAGGVGLSEGLDPWLGEQKTNQE